MESQAGADVSRYGLDLLICFAMIVSGGCVPVQYESWSESIDRMGDSRCQVSEEVLICNVEDHVKIAIIPPSTSPITESASLVVEVPAGHVVRLTGESVTIHSINPADSWRSPIISSSGFRYRDHNTLEMDSDAPGRVVTRNLLGSTRTSGHSSKTDNSIYRFEIRSEKSYPKDFVIEFPNILVDERLLVLPRMSFHNKRSKKMKGLFGT